ncbi:hypothetical protein ACTXT7_010296 [Hymenolepis weldensis]
MYNFEKDCQILCRHKNITSATWLTADMTARICCHVLIAEFRLPPPYKLSTVGVISQHKSSLQISLTAIADHVLASFLWLNHTCPLCKHIPQHWDSASLTSTAPTKLHAYKAYYKNSL